MSTATKHVRLVVHRNGSPGTDMVAHDKVRAHNVIATHYWETGHQELVFDSIEDARQYADDYDMVFVDARIRRKQGAE